MADIFFKKIVNDDFIRQLDGASNLVLPILPKLGINFYLSPNHYLQISDIMHKKII